MKTLIPFITILSFLMITACNPGNTENPSLVKTENGVVQGFTDDSSGLVRFYGIPFAKPPVGELRWKAPEPAENWEGILEAVSFRPQPVQTNVFGDMNTRADTLSEDCLYLNIWAPLKKEEGGLPVLVYFYGGGFVAGDASEPRYDGASMAKKGIVVLTVNYRLNIFGFLAHPELSAEAPYKASGNYGLLDQNMALQWVEKNIAAFGGDPERVTIAGESAGSISVSSQMASPLSVNLINGAIGESGAAINPTMAPVPLEEAEKEGLVFAQQAGLGTLADMRAMSTREIFDAYLKSGRFGFPAVIDGYFLPETLPEIFKTGQQAMVPLLAGWNSAEIPGFAFTQGPVSPEIFVQKVKEAYPGNAEEVLALYPHATPEEALWAATNLASDRFISYSTWKWLDLHQNHSEQPVYRYLFARIRPPLVDKTLDSGFAGGTVKKEEEAPVMPGPLGAPHATEIEYCMGNLYLCREFAWSEDDYKVSDIMLNYFANFIKNGDPNGEGLPEWPVAVKGDQTPPVMVIDLTSEARKAVEDERYRFHDRFFKN